MTSTDYEESGCERVRESKSSLASNTADIFRFSGGCAQPWYWCRKQTAVIGAVRAVAYQACFYKISVAPRLHFEGCISLLMMAIEYALGEGVDMIP